jgi:hypothetical protein
VEAVVPPGHTLSMHGDGVTMKFSLSSHQQVFTVAGGRIESHRLPVVIGHHVAPPDETMSLQPLAPHPAAGRREVSSPVMYTV